MKHLCDACAEHLAEAATVAQLLTMYNGALNLELHVHDRVDLIAALTFVVSQMPLPQAPAKLRSASLIRQGPHGHS